jgi:hypothetical protein
MCYWTSNVMVNFVHSHELNHHQSHEFLSKVQSGHTNFLYHTALQELNSSKVLLWFLKVKTYTNFWTNKDTQKHRY